MSSTIAINEPSIFISHVFPNKADLVYDTFAELFGAEYVDDVDVVKHDFNGQEICRVYVHFKKWPTTPEFQRLRYRLINGDTVKIVYDEPWYWKCVASKLPRITSKGSMTSPPKKRIVLDEKTKPVVPVEQDNEVAEETRPTKTPTTTPTATPETITPGERPELSNWADKVKQRIDIHNGGEAEAKTTKVTADETSATTNPVAVLDNDGMMAVNYEYCCYTRRLNLKTKEDFMNYLGGVIFSIVDKISPIFGNKITGMILELEPDIIVNALENKEVFHEMVIKCYKTLQEAIEAEMGQLLTK